MAEIQDIEGATNYDAYVAVKQWHPSVMENLEACVESGAGPDEIVAKLKEFTPGEVPDFVWEYIQMALNHLTHERNARRGLN